MDIDIDIKPDTDLTKLFPSIIAASMIESDKIKQHIVGNYFQNIPVDVETNLAAIPYNQAEQFGFYKIDMLHLNILNYFDNKSDIRILLKKQPDWSLLQQQDVVHKLFHLSKHYETLKLVKPTNISQLADVLALIRPNKRYLISKYIKNPDDVRTELYEKTDASDLRKSHAIPYAMLIVLQLHLIKAGIIQ